jgi:predicted membrane-bound mannosyltransferase
MLACAGAVSFMLFTSFFTNWRGPLDSLATYVHWLDRAEGNSPHVHPWHFYLGILTFGRIGRGMYPTEWLILLLALIGATEAFRRKPMAGGSARWVRFLTVYSVSLLLIYSIIPYKTPWCILGCLHGLVLLAGSGGVAVWKWARNGPVRIAVAVLGLAGLVYLGQRSYRASYVDVEKPRNPYVYAQTLSSVVDLTEKVRELVSVEAGRRDVVIQVMASNGDYWPLPWYFRTFQRVGWHGAVPEGSGDIPGDIVVASPAFADELGRRSEGRLQALGFFGLRPAVFLQLHVDSRLWAAYLGKQTRAAPAGPETD